MSTLNEIEARLAAATPGPWEAADYDVLSSDIDIADCQRLADAALIAHAPADLAALVAVVREVEALHRKVQYGIAGGGRTWTPTFVCAHCSPEADQGFWPCPTAAALQRLGGAS